MAHKVVWVLPSGRMISSNKTPDVEKKIQTWAALLPKTVFFFV